VVRIAYTSGTTGRPKGVAYTQARLQARLANHFLAMEYALSVDDAMLHVGPLTHAAGVYLFPCFLRGARNVVLDRFDPESLLAAIEQHRITHLMLVPTMMSRLVDAIEGWRRATGPRWRIHYGTAPDAGGADPPCAAHLRAHPAPAVRHDRSGAAAGRALSARACGRQRGWRRRAIGSCGRPTANVRIVLRDAKGPRCRRARWARSRWRTRARPR
jgi:long-chain acyl-CoA synthetase